MDSTSVLIEEGISLDPSNPNNKKRSFDLSSAFENESATKSADAVKIVAGGDASFAFREIVALNHEAFTSETLVASQDFTDYNGGDSVSRWTLVDDPDFDGKSSYVQDGEILFNTYWTNKTIKAMLGLDNLKELRAEGKLRSYKAGYIEDSYCEPKLEIGAARSIWCFRY